MIVIKIHEILKGGLHAKGFGVEVPGRPGLHSQRKGTNRPRMGIPASDLFLKSDRLMNILLCLKWKAEGKRKIEEDVMLFQLIQAIEQSLVCIRIPFVNFSQSSGSYIWGECDQGLRPRKRFFECLDKMSLRQSRGFEEAFHSQFLFTDSSEEVQEISGALRIGIEGDVKDLIPIRACFSDRSEHFYGASEGGLSSSREGLLGPITATAPGTLDRTSSADGEMKDGRVQ